MGTRGQSNDTAAHHTQPYHTYVHSLRAAVPTPRNGNNSRLYEIVPGSHSGFLLSHWLRHIGLISSRYSLPWHTFQPLLSPNSTHTARPQLPGATCVPLPAHLHRTSSPAPASRGAAPQSRQRAGRGRPQPRAHRLRALTGAPRRARSPEPPAHVRDPRGAAAPDPAVPGRHPPRTITPSSPRAAAPRNPGRRRRAARREL